MKLLTTGLWIIVSNQVMISGERLQFLNVLFCSLSAARRAQFTSIIFKRGAEISTAHISQTHPDLTQKHSRWIQSKYVPSYTTTMYPGEICDTHSQINVVFEAVHRLLSPVSHSASVMYELLIKVRCYLLL